MTTAVAEAPTTNGHDVNGSQDAQQQLARQQATPREIRVVHDESELSYLLDTARFEHMWRIAEAMALASVLPDHLRMDPKTKQELPPKRITANCLLIVNQSMRWRFDPFAVAAESYVVGGKLGYQGKLIAAVVHTRSNIKGRLKATYNSARGDALEVTISGTFTDEDEVRTITMTVGEGKTSNGMWTKDPQQKLWYSGVTKWARRHCPEVVMGVLTDDDIDRIVDSEARTITRGIEGPSKEYGSKSDEIADRLAGRFQDRDEGSQVTNANSGEESQVEPEVISQEKVIAVLERRIAAAQSGLAIKGIEKDAEIIEDEPARLDIYAKCKARREALNAGPGRKDGTLPGT